MSAVSLRALAQALGGTISGDQILAPGPRHSGRDRSLSVRLSPAAPDGFLAHSHAGDDWREVRDHVRDRLGISSPANKLTRRRVNPPRQRDFGAVDKFNGADQDRTARALALWAEARDPHGTAVERYLASRRLELPDDAAGQAIRSHDACAFARSCTPAMVCLVRDIVTNEAKAIHRTALTLDGHKADVNGHSRLSLGPVAGGAIKLTPDEDVTACLGIAEGIETALSLRLTPEFGPSPVWSLISAGGVASFPVLAGIECLWIAVDHDEAGIRAAQACGERWRAAGREVFLIKARTERADLNDLAREAGHAAA